VLRRRPERGAGFAAGRESSAERFNGAERIVGRKYVAQNERSDLEGIRLFLTDKISRLKIDRPLNLYAREQKNDRRLASIFLVSGYWNAMDGLNMCSFNCLAWAMNSL
jgi:hypothetical protein